MWKGHLTPEEVVTQRLRTTDKGYHIPISTFPPHHSGGEGRKIRLRIHWDTWDLKRKNKFNPLVAEPFWSQMPMKCLQIIQEKSRLFPPRFQHKSLLAKSCLLLPAILTLDNYVQSSLVSSENPSGKAGQSCSLTPAEAQISIWILIYWSKAIILRQPYIFCRMAYNRNKQSASQDPLISLRHKEDSFSITYSLAFLSSKTAP